MPEATTGGTGPRTALEVDMAAHEGAIDLAHDLIERLYAEHEDLAAADRFRFETAVVEILANIVEHAFAADEEPGVRRLSLRVAVDAETLRASLSDNGQPSDVDLSQVTMPDEDAESGRGLALALRAVDDLTFRHVGGRNHWELLCLRAP